MDKDTRLGTVHLNVAEVERVSAFYQENLGLLLRPGSGPEHRLGTARETLLEIHPLPAGQKAKRSAGLYHFCLAVERRNELGWWLQGLLAKKVPLQGLVDHRMAEAVYLSDPEGNGIELNWDRPRSAWPDLEVLVREGNAELDVEGLLAEAQSKPVKALPEDARVGHIHLHVADLAACEKFYCDVIGFDKRFEFPGQAVFTSAGGYHHHVAFNIWNGTGIEVRQEDRLGLRYFTVVCKEGDLKGIRDRAGKAGVKVADTAQGMILNDPSGNAVLLTFA